MCEKRACEACVRSAHSGCKGQGWAEHGPRAQLQLNVNSIPSHPQSVISLFLRNMPPASVITPLLLILLIAFLSPALTLTYPDNTPPSPVDVWCGKAYRDSDGMVHYTHPFLARR